MIVNMLSASARWSLHFFQHCCHIIGVLADESTPVASSVSLCILHLLYSSLTDIYGHARTRGLQWRNVYLIFLIGFPCVSTVAEILVVSKYDAFEQSNYDNTMCDVTTPLWYVIFNHG